MSLFGLRPEEPAAIRIREAATRGTLSHALLLTGSGDRMSAACFAAAALECTGEESRPCGVCPACRKVLAGIHPDVITVRDPDHKNIAVDVVRAIRADAYIRPNEGRRKVYVFPDCALLTEQDQNVLLKVVEEGPPYAAFLFCAENAAVVLQTLRSRCVELKLHPAAEGGGEEVQAAEALCRCLAARKRGKVTELAVRLEKKRITREDLSALEKGLPNLLHHVNTIRNTFHLPCVVAINAFPTDTAAELRLVEDKCRALGVNAVLSEVWAKGGEGGRALAQEVVRLCDQPQLAPFSFAYPDNASLAYKLNAIVGRVYGGAQAVLTPAAQKQLQRLTELGFGDLPVCMAKTQYSLSDDPTLLGAPTGFTVTVRSLRVSAGAGFIVAYTGDIMTMPGLPRVPAAEKIDVDENGVITGLF